MKTLLIFGPAEEFNAFNRFNSMIPKFKNGYDKVIVSTSYNSVCILNNADEFICPKTIHKENNYPYILNSQNRTERFYINDNFLESIKMKYSDTVDYLFYMDAPHRDYMNLFGEKHQNKLPKNTIVYTGKEHSTMGNWIISDFKRLSNNLINGYRILPWKEDKEKIENKYSHLFNDMTYVILTRNLINKQPELYNSTDKLLPMINTLLERGYRIINVGFPVKSFDIKNPEYIEVNAEMTYSEFLCFAYLGNAIIIPSDCNGFSTHICTNLDIFRYGDEWGEPNIFTVNRKKVNSLFTEIININDKNDYIPKINKHVSHCTKQYTNKPIIHYI
jgi:hypothetical protein